MRFKLIFLLAILATALNAQGWHSISGHVLADRAGNVGIEVLCVDSRGHIHHAISDSSGKYRFNFIPLGKVWLRPIQPKGYEYLESRPRHIGPPFSECTRDVEQDLDIIWPLANVVLPTPHFAQGLSIGTFHFHPNADPQWVFE